MVGNSTGTPEPPESIQNASVSDQATDDDSLGFEPYVTAIAQFLKNPKTKPPLTLSIEGEWGSGKSSFMKQLRKKLEGEPTVWFNAWRHDKAEALWAAFALEFIRQISRPRRRRDIFRVLKGNLKLFWLRFDWKNGFQLISLLLLGLILIVPLVILSLRQGYKWIEQLTEFIKTLSQYKFNQTIINNWRNLLYWVINLAVIGSSVIGFITLLIKLLNISDPKNDLTKYLRSPNYQNQIPFVEKFHEDFRKIVEAFAGKKKVYVFIDDLDRCEVPKSADLMQAINLMRSNDPQLIFILGMDRQKVAAGLAVKYKELIPYLALDTENEGSGNSSFTGMDYAYTFMEKFIQLPFQVPQPAQSDFERFLEKMSSSTAKEISKDSSFIQTIGQHIQSLINKIFPSTQVERNQTENQVQASSPQTPPPSEEKQQIQRIKRIEIEKAYNSSTVRNIVLMVASALDYNPRRLKQFVNVFRLKAYIANDTGLFDEVQQGTSIKKHLTLEQLGKFTAISLKWPRLLVDLNANHTLLAKLQKFALNPSDQSDQFDSTTKYWCRDQKLVELLCYSRNDEQQTSEPKVAWEYSLEEVDIDKLLQVSPRVTRSVLSSEKEVDYTKLRDLLAAGKWKEADYETFLVMLQAVGRKEPDYIRLEELLNFPCADLRTIDQLWVKYSNGRFGFSVQKEIYLSVGGKPDGKFDEEAWKQFGDRVGFRVKENWISYSEVIFDTTAPEGHLPLFGRKRRKGNFSSLASRLVNCNI
jgi:hypothetical protein